MAGANDCQIMEFIFSAYLKINSIWLGFNKMLIDLYFFISGFTIILYIMHGLSPRPSIPLFLFLARFFLSIQCLYSTAVLAGIISAPHTIFVVPMLCLAGEYLGWLSWLRPIERCRIMAEIAKHLPQASRRQARAVYDQMVEDGLRIGSFTWHDDCVFIGRGKHSKLCRKSGKWISVTPEIVGFLKNYGVEKEILKQEFPDLLMKLRDDDAKSICSLMYFE